MRLKELLEQLPPQEGEKDLVFVFKSRFGDGQEVELDRITILGDVVITLVEK